jgi:hypothetical protein
MNHSVTLRTAWAMVKRRRMLWVFGLLAALGGGGFNFTWSIGNQTGMLFELPLGTRALLRYLFGSPEMGTTLIVIGLALGVSVFVVHTFATGALIQLVDKIDQRQTTTVGEGARAGRHYFWPMLALRVVLAMPLLIAGLAVTGSIEPSLSSFFAAPIGERLFALSLIERLTSGGAVLVVVSLLVAGISLGAARALVLEDLPVWKAIVRGTELLVTRLGDYVVMTLLFTVIGLAVSVVFALLLTPIAFVSMLPGIGKNIAGFDVFMFTGDNFGPLAVLAMALAVVFGLFVSTFTSAVWTLAYRQWQTRERLDDHDLNEIDEPLSPAPDTSTDY